MQTAAWGGYSGLRFNPKLAGSPRMDRKQLCARGPLAVIAVCLSLCEPAGLQKVQEFVNG